MHISRVSITGFRNIPSSVIELSNASVLIGPNEAGKSNVIRAIRLAIDSDLPPRERQLSESDLSRWEIDGATWYMNAVEICVTITGIDEHPDGSAYFLEVLDPGSDMREATLKYRFQPAEWDGTWQALDTIPDLSTYRWRVVGGNAERSALDTLRNAISVVSLDAIRNPFQESDRWQTSPLRGLLGRRADALTELERTGLATAIQDLFGEVEKIESIASLRTELLDEFAGISKDGFVSSVHLAATKSEPTSFIKTLRLVERRLGDHPLSFMSTGAQNVLSIAVARKELAERVEKHQTALPVLILEEPEAHLHPAMQRAVFSSLLGEDSMGSTIVSTHSPALVSVTEPRFVVRVGPADSRGLKIRSLADTNPVDLHLDEIAKFLLGTRSELLLARRVLLVEGLAEAILAPNWGEAIINGGLDRIGVSVVPIEGTHFAPFIAVCRALGIPYRVATDGDPPSAEKPNRVTGQRRKQLLVDKFPDSAARIFVGDDTLETDIAAIATNATAIRSAAEQISIDSSGTSADIMRRLVGAVGKGSAATLLASANLEAPDYFKEAIRSFAEELADAQ